LDAAFPLSPHPIEIAATAYNNFKELLIASLMSSSDVSLFRAAKRTKTQMGQQAT
jgi:hypothetical protein